MGKLGYVAGWHDPYEAFQVVAIYAPSAYDECNLNNGGAKHGIYS